MTVARQFYLLTIVTFLLVVTFLAGVMYRFTGLSAEGTRLIDSLERTEALNQELASDNRKQIDELRGQMEHLDPTFAARFRRLDYLLGQKYTEYLRLDIGESERLAVERIRALQAEMSILSMHIYERLRSGDRVQATARQYELTRLEGKIRDEFERLNGVQTAKLRVVLNDFDEAVKGGLLVAVGLAVLLLLVIDIGMLVLHGRVFKPVRSLLAQSDRIRLGDFSGRAPAATGSDELGQLAQGFSFMAQALAESYASLEQKVEERTRQLDRVQRQLVQTEKMSAVGLLVSGVAHELNNPLAAIMGLADLAMTDLKNNCGEAARLLKDIDTQAERCRRIVLNLLQFARRQEPHKETVSLNVVVEQALQLREYELSTRNVTLARDFDPRNPLLYADPHQMQQVALNLLNNATDAIHQMGRPGTISIRTRLDRQHVSLEFLDDGPGFCDASRVFEPFYTTKQVGEGTGLGLSVCYGIVQEHQGTIVAGRWEKGARVTVTLPVGTVTRADDPTIQVPAPTVRAAAPGGPPALRALVVDDEPLLLRLQTQYLAKIGIDVVAVSTGEDAQRCLEEQQIDLVVSDVRMPGSVDGVQLYEWVQQHRPQLANRFVFVSGDLVGLNLDEFFSRTSVPRIAKPFRFEAYAKTVRQVVEP